MGGLLSLPVTLLNFLLPFTKPGTPLLQDLVHTAILCGTLYYAPQIAEWYNARQTEERLINGGTQTADEQDTPTEGVDTRQEDNIPLDERLVLQDDGEEVVGGPPPSAPTPPPQEEVEDFEDPAPFAQPEAGPANDRPRPTPANRTIGAKKAKSLARKDQRRAYHEFHRQEAELRRLQEQEGAEERDAALAAEKARRAQVEEEIREKERVEREARKRDQEREAQEENERRERVVKKVREETKSKGAVDLVDVAWAEGKDKIWVERLVRASGLLAQLQKDGTHVMITSHGWLVKVDQALVKQAYTDAEVYGNSHGGKVDFAEFGKILEKGVLARAKA
ncbi:hypothetical protein BKA66DRAFT_405876 [Pyrenochaeta sp. MPI-SDFR-AT-0127]|nr:hypothetical protein BKA66DRAFT_405876 [Pyrenochaeta sp. MPI-SDFR-AT-0127]